MMSNGTWSAAGLSPHARGCSASRRTDIPALYARWFEQRLREGYADYIPAGPPRRVRRSLAPADVTHFTFWTRYPKPFARVLDRVLAAGYPVLFNVTITGLARTAPEPFVPETDKVIDAVSTLSRTVGAQAVLWRYDPVFLSEWYPLDHHVETFSRLAGRLAGLVDRVVISFVEPYGRRVMPDLRAYGRETGDRPAHEDLAARIDAAGTLAEIARSFGLPLALCCQGEVRRALGLARADCNGFRWAARVYPALAAIPPRPARPLRDDCGCSLEFDIGCYDTCILGCRYSYGSSSRSAALRNFKKHDPADPCIIPGPRSMPSVTGQR